MINLPQFSFWDLLWWWCRWLGMAFTALRRGLVDEWNFDYSQIILKITPWSKWRI